MTGLIPTGQLTGGSRLNANPAYAAPPTTASVAAGAYVILYYTQAGDTITTVSTQATYQKIPCPGTPP